MISELALLGLEIDPARFVPVLIAISVGIVVWMIVSFVSRRGEETSERLQRFGKVQRGGERLESSTGAGSEKLQDLLERAAPALAKPLTPQSEEEQSELRIRLANGGWRGESAPTVYLGIRFAFLIAGLVLALIFIIPTQGFSKNGIMYTFLCAGLAFYLPAIFVWWCVKKRQEQVFFGLPDALDLMVVCVEAGLGLDAAMRKVCEEMDQSFPVIAEEFSICNFQLQMGRPRREVLHDLGIRTGVDDMKSLAAILIQADRFGSSIAQALRVQSDSMRVRRKQQAEERAAKTAVQLIFPLVLFIFPAIFIVLVGPAGLQVYDVLLSMDKK